MLIGMSETAASLLKLVEGSLTSQELRDLTELYVEDLPSPVFITNEYQRWEMRSQVGPSNVTNALDQADPDIYPNINPPTGRSHIASNYMRV
jgi:hypothetical protein